MPCSIWQALLIVALKRGVLRLCVLIAMLLLLSTSAQFTGLVFFSWFWSDSRGICPVVPHGKPLHHAVLLKLRPLLLAKLSRKFNVCMKLRFENLQDSTLELTPS
jgi:hypothetical protein